MAVVIERTLGCDAAGLADNGRYRDRDLTMQRTRFARPNRIPYHYRLGGRPARVTWVCLLLACISMTGQWAAPTYAQSQEPWTPPICLSCSISGEPGETARSVFPVLVTDAWGAVHVFWPATIDAEGSMGDALYYAHWTEGSWSFPYDVLYRPGASMRVPQAVADVMGWMHVAWTEYAGGVQYSRAQVMEAASSRSWSSPVPVSNIAANGVSLAVGADGVVHLVYCGFGSQTGLYHTSSADGVTWAGGEWIGPAFEYGCTPRLAADDRGRLHAVWEEGGEGETYGLFLYYARSEDGGQTWSAPFELDRQDERFSGEYGPDYANVATVGADQVHIVWYGAPAGQRWHQWSADGGVTWSLPQQVSPNHRGMTLPPGMAVDSAGRLHVVWMGWQDSEVRPSGAFHAFWEDGHWSVPAHIGDRLDWSAEYTSLVVADGNLLHTVWTDTQEWSIWASRLETDAPRVEPSAQPTLAPALTIQPADAATGVAATAGSPATSSDITPTPTVLLGATPGNGPSVGSVILAGVLPSGLVVGLILLLYWMRRKR